MHVHEFLIDEAEPAKPVQAMVDLREYVDGLTELTAQFKPKEAIDSRNWEKLLSHQALYALGSWPVPDRLANGRTARWVNPAYVHAHTYSDLVERCDCGYGYGYRRGGNIDTGAITVHEEDCSADSRRLARLRLRLRRVAWLKSAALLWVRQPIARQRLGFDYDEAASRLIRPLPESYHDWYGRGKEIAANTMMVLRDLGVDAQLIADAYGTSRQTVYTYKAHCDRTYIWNRAPAALEDGRAKP